MKPLLLRHLSGEAIGRFPVWFMRQAGRYLPSYQAMRGENTFWEMVTRSELASKATLLPVTELDVDAAILFSDILTPIYGLGHDIQMKESIGPVLTPFVRKDFEGLIHFEPKKHVAFVGEAIRQTFSHLPAEKALLGFAGAPWTVACYLTEGHGKTQFHTIQKMAYQDPKRLATYLSHVAHLTKQYLAYQIQSGAHMVQLFDTWLSTMPRFFLEEYYLGIVEGLFSELAGGGAALCYFPKDVGHWLKLFRNLPIDVLSVGCSMGLREAEEASFKKFSLQGNLDPIALFAEPSYVRLATRKIVEEARTLSRPAIMNLGHGILPKTPLESVRAFVAESKTLWV